MPGKHKKKKKTSLADIAQSLGVSRTLVSMVLNNRGNENGINPETQKKVLAKAKELKYKPNLLARGLRLGRTNTIGLIVTDISNVFYSQIARSIEDHASKKGFRIMMCSSDEDPEKEAELIQMFKERQADGLIIATSQKSSIEIDSLIEENYPFVLIDRHLGDIAANSVTVDNYHGAKEVVQHFTEMGWDRIAMLAISPIHISTMQERITGFKDGLTEHGITFNPSMVKEIPFFDVKNGVYKELNILLEGPNPVRAIFVANNSLTVACLEYVADMELSIPEDLSIISFDDIDFFKLCSPPITAVSQPVKEIGEKAIHLLLKEIQSKEFISEKEQIQLSTKLQVRRSCGKKVLSQ